MRVACRVAPPHSPRDGNRAISQLSRVVAGEIGMDPGQAPVFSCRCAPDTPAFGSICPCQCCSCRAVPTVCLGGLGAWERGILGETNALPEMDSEMDSEMQ